MSLGDYPSKKFKLKTCYKGTTFLTVKILYLNNEIGFL